MGEIVAVRGHYEQTPPKLALQKGSRDCGGCSANLGRRLDLLEARVLSHWHEFLVHKSEVQRKFEDVFAACRGHRPKGSMSAHADLERRLSFCEGVVRDSEDERARHLELKVLSEDTWRGLERLQNRVTQESDNLGKVSTDLQRRLAVLDKKSEELQLGLQSQVTDMRKEMQDVIVRASRELGVELRSSFERRIRQGHDEALESAEIASQRCMKSVMSEMNASVMTAEARAQQQCARLRGELEVAEAAAEDIWRRSSNEIARAVAASETSFKPRLQQIDEDARAAMTALELSLERRLLQHSSEAAENLRSLDARAQQNMAEVAESITHVEQLLRSQRSEALASLEALDSRLATQSRRCTDSEAREASLERRLQKDHVQLADDLHTNMLQVRRELADRTGTVESRVIAEVAGLRDELKDSIAAGRDEWAMRLSEAQQQLTRLSGASRSLQDSLAGCQKEVAELRDTQHAMENSVAGLHASRDSELRLLAEDSRAFKAKFTEEILDAQGVSRSLGHRMSTVEAACAGADRSASSARDEVLAMRTSFRSSLDHVEAAKDELSKELETQGRAVRQAVEKAHLDGHQAACEELYKEQRNLRAEVSEQLQRLTSVERRAKDVARGEEASAQRVAALSEQVERLVRAAHSPSDAGHREVFAELQTAVTRMEELQSQVNRLLWDSKKSTEKWETVLPRLQEAERAVERLSRGPTQMHREMQELRSQLAETRLQASLTPRSDRAGNRSLETRRLGLGWLGEL